MSMGPVTVESGSLRVSSTSEKAADMIAALSKEGEEAKPAREVKDEAEPEEKPKSKLSQAGYELGKKGGKAAAKARAEREETEEPEVKAKPAAAETEEEPEQEPDEEPEADPKSRSAKRVQEATRAAAEAKRELAKEREARTKAERERDEIRQRAEPAKEAEPEAPKGKPKQDDFATWDEYLDARDAYNRTSWEAENEVKTQQEAQRRHVEGVVSSYSKAMKEAEKEEPDFWENLSPDVAGLETSFTAQNPNGKNWIADILVKRPQVAAALMRHFSAESDDFERIAALNSPYEVAYEVGMIEARLGGVTADNSSPKGRPVTKLEVSRAPFPKRSASGAPSTDSGDVDEDAPLSAFIRKHGERELIRSRR